MAKTNKGELYDLLNKVECLTRVLKVAKKFTASCIETGCEEPGVYVHDDGYTFCHDHRPPYDNNYFDQARYDLALAIRDYEAYVATQSVKASRKAG